MELHRITRESTKLGLATTKCATLMDLLTPYCGAAWQSPLTDLTQPPANLSISHRQDRPGGCIASNHPITASCGQKRGERIEKVCEREIGIDLIRYTAVSRFGLAQQLNTLK